MVNIHQQPKHKSKFSNAVKFLLVLVVLVLLVVFKDLIYAWQKDKKEDAIQSDQVTHNNELSPTVQAPAASPIISSPNPAPPSQATSSAPSAPATPSVPAIIGKLKITATPTSFLNVRKSPSTSAAIISKVYPGNILSYTAEQSGWYQIILPTNQTGWVSSQYITTNLSAPASPPVIRHSDNERRGDGE